jgi:hypothetical protein
MNTFTPPKNSIAPEIPQNDSQESEDPEIKDLLETERGIENIPLDNAKKRITKKPFGIYITTENSPVQPERFSGYHTGTDFEIFSHERTLPISVFALCDGKILEKRFISGYGGLIVQSCSLKNEPVTILYGHLSLTKSPKKPGDFIKKGEEVGILGEEISNETDGERKHLHLSIYRGSSIDYRGYVAKKSDLSQWINPEEVLEGEHL